ncbi:MAG: type 4a pilus biogenesis protein PilO [Pseudomonadota bacterium]
MALQDSLDQLKAVDFNDLDFDNFGSWPGPVKGIAMLLVFLLIAGGGYYLHITDKQKGLERVEAKEADLKKQYEDKAAQAANLDALRQQKLEMEAIFDSLLRQLPTDTEVPGLLEDITRTALDNDLTIESIDLRSENKTEFYIELPIEVVVEGTYHKIGSFVSGVANLSRIVTLHDFEVEPTDSAPILRMQIVAKTYRYLEEAN